MSQGVSDCLKRHDPECCIILVQVGGEFPVAASSASERAEGSTKLQKLRGQTVVLVFSMQVSCCGKQAGGKLMGQLLQVHECVCPAGTCELKVLATAMV